MGAFRGGAAHGEWRGAGSAAKRPLPLDVAASLQYVPMPSTVSNLPPDALSHEAFWALPAGRSWPSCARTSGDSRRFRATVEHAERV